MITWPETLTFGDIERIRRQADIDLLKVLDADPGEGRHALSVWEDIVGDIGITVNVLRLWLEISDEELPARGKEFDGKTIREGLVALEAAIDDFFSETGQGPTFGILARKARQSGETVRATLSRQLEQRVDQSLQPIFDSNAGDLLESLRSHGLTRTPTGSSTSSPGAPSGP